MNQQEFEKIFAHLSPRRKEVLKGILAGETDVVIANRMGILEPSVRKFIERIEYTANSVYPILELVNQLTGWVQKARVVLTCRLNLWEANKNALETFDTYRTLDFSYGNAQTSDRVGLFISRWFVADSHSGRRLRSHA